MAATKIISQLLLLSCLLLFPSVFALSKESSKIIEEINSDGPYIGLIASSSSVEKAFFARGEYTPDPETPTVKISGRTFHKGTVVGRKVIYVRSGAGLVNAAAVTQLLLKAFEVRAVLQFGIAGKLNDSLNIGDVIVSKKFVNSGLWDWQNPNVKVSENDITELVIKHFNDPRTGSNSLGRVGYSPEEFYSPESKDPQKIVWFNVDSKYLEYASLLAPLINLERCVKETDNHPDICLKKQPKMVTGLKGTTSNIYVNNTAYREFLFQKFGVSTADRESTAVIMTSLSNGFRVISFSGLANLAGAEKEGEDYTQFKSVVADNVAHVVVRFIQAFFSENKVLKSLIKMYE